VYRELQELRPLNINRVDRLWQDNLAEGRPNEWRCRAGARYFYVDEFGRVHYCSQFRRGGGTPLESYTPADVRREYHARKACAPFCTINCAQQSALLDNWRSPQHGVATPPPAVGPALP
jgi:hypothetical protein